MKPIGFSTGALAKGDFATGLSVQRDVPRIDAVELSALRDHELPLLVDAIPSLDLDGLYLQHGNELFALSATGRKISFRNELAGNGQMKRAAEQLGADERFVSIGGDA